MTNDDGERRVELNDLNMFVVEGADATNGELVEGSPVMSAEMDRELYQHSGLEGGGCPTLCPQTGNTFPLLV